jgi:hypothetical protein
MLESHKYSIYMYTSKARYKANSNSPVDLDITPYVMNLSARPVSCTFRQESYFPCIVNQLIFICVQGRIWGVVQGWIWGGGGGGGVWGWSRVGIPTLNSYKLLQISLTIVSFFFFLSLLWHLSIMSMSSTFILQLYYAL